MKRLRYWLLRVEAHPGSQSERKSWRDIGIGLPSWFSGKEFACQCRKCSRHRFDPWVGKISWNRKWQRTPVFLPGKSQGQRSLLGYSPWGRKELDITEHAHACDDVCLRALSVSAADAWTREAPQRRWHLKMRRSKDESNRQRKPDIKWRGQGSAETERAVDSGRLEKGADKVCFILPVL